MEYVRRLSQPRYRESACAVRCWPPCSFCLPFATVIPPVASGYREQAGRSGYRAEAGKLSLRGHASVSKAPPIDSKRARAAFGRLQVTPPFATPPPRYQVSCALEQENGPNGRG